MRTKERSRRFGSHPSDLRGGEGYQREDRQFAAVLLAEAAIQAAAWSEIDGGGHVRDCPLRSGAVLDAVAFRRSDDSANPDKVIVAALRRAMATATGGSPHAGRQSFGRSVPANAPRVAPHCLAPRRPLSLQQDDVRRRDPHLAAAKRLDRFLPGLCPRTIAYDAGPARRPQKRAAIPLYTTGGSR